MPDRSRLAGFVTRQFAAALMTGGALLAATPVTAAVLLPPNYFDQIPQAPQGGAAVEADQLVQNANTGVITADGRVSMRYMGYTAQADRLTFNQRTRELRLSGNVLITDPGGTEYSADSVVVTGGFKNAVLDALVMVTPDGAMVTATKAQKLADEKTVLEAGTYAPCGKCIDENGRRIGWRVRTKKIVQNTAEGYVDLDSPVLEVLGVPIAWLPFLRFPDPSDPRNSGFRLPSYAMSDKTGLKLTLPYYQAINRDMSVLLMPSLISTQGLLMGAEFAHNVGDWGRYTIAGHGIYQIDPSRFTSGFGDTRWRGAIQTSGKFTPVKDWTAGWSYTAFTDPAFLRDYVIMSAGSTINEAYAQYLTPDSFADARVQQFVLLGEITQAQQDRQGNALPAGRFRHYADLGERGRIAFLGNVLNVARAADHTTTNAQTYVIGHEGQKFHANAEVMWSRQTIFGGAVVTPYAGARVDAAYYDGASPLNPGQQSLFALTPIAALDVRYPFVARGNGLTQVIEPVGQIYYRGGPTAPGITNDDAVSFAFDDTNLFSFNHFSGSDRQDTGLRANLGAHYALDVDNGLFFDIVAGQTFQLAGPNGLATADAAYAGAGAGLDGAVSDYVVGLSGGYSDNIDFGAKARLNAQSGEVALFAANTGFTYAGWRLALDYTYQGADVARGFAAAQQDAGGSISIPVADYWTAKANLGWDITAGHMIGYGASLVYDDGFVQAGARVTTSGPLVYDPNSTSFKISFKLKGPDGTAVGL